MSLRVAIVTPLFWPSVGGIQTFVRDIARHLQENGDTVCVFTSRVSSDRAIDPRLANVERDLPERERLDNFEIRRYDSGGRAAWLWGLGYRVLYRLKLPQNRWFYDRFRTAGAHADRMIEDIAAFKPDVLLGAPYLRFLLPILLRAQKKTGARLYVKPALHFDAPTSFESEYGKLKACNGLFVGTAYEKERLAASGVPSVNIHVTGGLFDPLPLETPLARNAPAELEGRPYALFIARKSEDKGVPALLEAMRLVVREIPEARLVLAGETTPYFDRIAGSLEPHVLDMGLVDNAMKERLLSAATVFAMPSRIDSYGIVYMEAWTRGVSVIAADTPTMRSVVEDGVDGLLVPYGDAPKLAQALLKLFQNPDLSRRLGDEGRRRVHARTSDRKIQKQIRRILLGSGGSGKA